MAALERLDAVSEGIALAAGQQLAIALPVVQGQVGVAAGAQDAADLQQPGIGEVGDVGEDLAAVDEVEVTVGERQVRRGAGGDEIDRRQVVLRPQDVRPADVRAPQL